jgi:hypothetical protein
VPHAHWNGCRARPFPGAITTCIWDPHSEHSQIVGSDFAGASSKSLTSACLRCSVILPKSRIPAVSPDDVPRRRVRPAYTRENHRGSCLSR